jgi:LysM repeat protein
MKWRLLIPFPALAVAAAFGLSACGTASGAQSGATVVNLGTTNWATIPTVAPTVATIPATTLEPVPGSKTTTVQEYEVKEGDNRTLVASLWGISLQELDEINAGTSGYESFLIGLKIKIPVGATTPTAGEEPGDTIPLVELCVEPGTYTLVSGDFPKIVADKFKVTVKALDAVNEDTNGYGGFIVGTKINIPCQEEEASN